MSLAKADIIAQLQKEILPLQGFKSIMASNVIDVKLGPVKHAFPNAKFPIGAIHEFLCVTPEDKAATSGFVTGILQSLMKSGGVCLWISTSITIFPPALRSFGIEPDHIIFISCKKEKEVLWATEEALKCEGLAAVIGEIRDFNFTDSRRLQLAVEQSKITGFIVRTNPKKINTTASIARWRIQSLPSSLPDGMPGVGFPKWNIELLKVRNGKPGQWQMEWINGKFTNAYQPASVIEVKQRKTG